MRFLFDKIRNAWSWPITYIIQKNFDNLEQILIESEINRQLHQPEYFDKHRLERYGFRVYSQNDEDGIIQEIFNRIGVTNKIFIEFGVGNGLENNTHFLLLQSWKGLWIEGDSNLYLRIIDTFSDIIRSKQLTVKNTYVNKENINSIFSNAGFIGEIDLLSIDIDGNDYHIFNEINVVNPRVVIIEYNSKFPPSFEWHMEYNGNHIWDGSDKQGASLKALEKLATKKGYQLVGTNINGINAFFVRTDIADSKFFTPANSESLYNPPRWGMKYKKNGHITKHFLGTKVD